MVVPEGILRRSPLDLREMRRITVWPRTRQHLYTCSRVYPKWIDTMLDQVLIRLIGSSSITWEECVLRKGIDRGRSYIQRVTPVVQKLSPGKDILRE